MREPYKLGPALTEEEWREREFVSFYGVSTTYLQVDHKDRLFATSVMADEQETVILNESFHVHPLHKTAALCLKGQPFGFTREDVALLAHLDGHEGITDGEGNVYLCTMVPADQYARIRSLADRIEALLPPEDESDE